jgi:hypothetical protein
VWHLPPPALAALIMRPPLQQPIVTAAATTFSTARVEGPVRNVAQDHALVKIGPAVTSKLALPSFSPSIVPLWEWTACFDIPFARKNVKVVENDATGRSVVRDALCLRSGLDGHDHLYSWP